MNPITHTLTTLAVSHANGSMTDSEIAAVLPSLVRPVLVGCDFEMWYEGEPLNTISAVLMLVANKTITHDQFRSFQNLLG